MSTTEISTSKVILDNSQAENALKELRAQAKQVRKEMEDLKLKNDPGLAAKKKEFADLSRKIEETRKSTFNLDRTLKNINGSSLKELTKAQRQLTAEIRNATREGENEIASLKRKQAQLKEVGSEISKIRKEMAPSKGGSFMDKMADGLNRYQTFLMAAFAGIAGAGAAISSMLQGNAELSDSMSDVAKTSGLATAEVKDMYRQLGKIDTRTPRKELLDLAYVAGKLGYTAESEIIGFVKAADQIGVALSRDLGGNIEDAVTSLGKLTDVFKLKEMYSVEDALLKTGSAINALGAAGTASESYIVEFTARMGGIAPQAGLTIQQIMGLGATLDQLGQQSETSGTALTNLLTKMFSKPGEFAAIAGVDVRKFSTLLKTDANEALIMFLEGMQKNKGGLQELATKFADLGIDGQRAITVVGALSGNIEMLREAQKLSNIEFQKGSSLTNEFNLKNENMAGNLARIGKALHAAFVNSTLMSALGSIASTMAEWFKIPMAEKLEEERAKTNLLANRLLEANITAATRNKLYAELKGLSPDVLKGIDKEAIAYDMLRKNLEEYNNQMIRKIAVSKADELVNDAAQKAAGYMTKKTQYEDQIRALMIVNVEGVKKFNGAIGAELDKIVNNSYLNFEQKYRLFRRTIDNNKDKRLGTVQTNDTRYNYLFDEYSKYSDLEQKATAEVNKAAEKRDSLAQGLSSAISEVTEKVITNTEVTIPNTDATKKDTEAKETLSDAFKELEKQISDFDVKINNAISSGDTPLAQKLISEKKAAEDLLAVYTEMKAQLEEGWSFPGLEMGPQPEEIVNGIESLVSKTAVNVSSDGKKSKSPLKPRDVKVESGPSDQVQEFEDQQSQLSADWRESEFQMTSSLNDAVFTMITDRQNAEYEHQLAILDKQKEKELSNKRLTEEQKAAIENKYELKARKIKQEQWKKQRNADALSTTVQTILAVMKAGGPFTPLGAATAISGALGVATILAQPVPEFSKGRYNVTGATTGKSYSNVEYAGQAVTGLYTRPALVAETGAEMIIDPGTTKNIMLNFPAILDAIQMARVPQYASGRIPSQAPAASGQQNFTTDPLLTALIKENTEVMKRLAENGVKGIWVLNDLQKIQNRKSVLEASTEM